MTLSSLRMLDNPFIHFCMRNYLWLNFQELTMKDSTSSLLKCFILYLTDELHAENICISLSVESFRLYKNWIIEYGNRYLYLIIDYKTFFWVFSASLKICSTSQKRNGTKDIRQTETLSLKSWKMFSSFWIPMKHDSIKHNTSSTFTPFSL